MTIHYKPDRWDAQHYKKHSDGQFERGMSAIQSIKFQGNEAVLDVGCGDGRITAQIAKHVSHGSVVGVDISLNMISEANRSFGGISNLKFQCVDAAYFFSDTKFDLVFSFAAFHWFKDQVGVLRNIYNNLKTGGKVIMKVSAVYKGPVSEVHESKKWAPYLLQHEQAYFPHTKESLSKLFKESGFHNVDVIQKVVARTYKSREELFNWAFAWVPHSTKLPDDKAREFTHDIVDFACKASHGMCEVGQIVLESAFLDVIAFK